MIYLDNHATTRTAPAVVEAMLPYFTESYGNAHSVEHAMGVAADAAVERARDQVAALIGAEGREIIFTSGATEANNIALFGAARQPGRIISVVTEHPAVLEPLVRLGGDVLLLPVAPSGLIDLDQLRAALAVPTRLVSVMAANNEIGVLQDLPAIAALAREHGALFHSDAAQAAGHIRLDARATGIDLLSLSAHKLHGPKGVGALFVRHRPRIRLPARSFGGGQEGGLRPGTLPVPLIVGFGAACALAASDFAAECERQTALRDHMLTALRAAFPGLRLNGDPTRRLPNNLNVTLPGIPARELMRRCPELCLSTGSACSTGDPGPSHVQTAIGLSAQDSRCTLRIGLGRFTSRAELDHAVAILARAALTIET